MEMIEVQRALSVLGYRPGRLDGLDGPKTRGAVMAFACDEGLAGDGLHPTLLGRLEERLADARAAGEERVFALDDLREILFRRGRRLDEAEAREAHNHLSREMVRSGIAGSLDRESSFLAQLLHESGGLRYREEIASGEAYEGRRDLGNTQPGDGVRFKGRGYIQLTGRANYARYGEMIGVDLIRWPERAAQIRIAARLAVAYWTDHNLNSIADTASEPGGAEHAFLTITRRINGGTNGLEDRRQWLAVCWNVLKT